MNSREEIFTPGERDANTERKRQLIELVASGGAILIVGAGSSRRVGYPDWTGLLRELEDLAGEYSKGYGLSRKKVQGNPEKPSFWQKLGFFVRFLLKSESFTPDCEKREKDPLAYAEDIKSFICRQEDGLEKYYALLERLFEPKDSPYTGFHRRLISLPFRGFLTTNYDPVLEAALSEIEPSSAYNNWLIINEDFAGQVSRFLMEVNNENMPRRVAHLHGRYNYPPSIILSAEDYQQAYGLGVPTNQAEETAELTLHQKLLWSIFANRRCVFVGFSMKDPYFNKILDTVSTDLRRWGRSIHFAIMSISPSSAEDSKGESERLKNSYGVDTVYYEDFDNSHRGLDHIVTEIYERCAAEDQPPIDIVEGEPPIDADILDWMEQVNQRMERRIDDGN